MKDRQKRQIYWPQRACERGVALAMLLWFLAAMAMLVASIGYLARVDIKLTQLQVTEARAKAAGDGAIRVMLAEVFASSAQDAVPYDRGATLSSSYDFNGTTVRVDIVSIGLPADTLETGNVGDVDGASIQRRKLFDINYAPPQQLQQLFRDQEDAASLTEKLIRWRELEPEGFRAIEDLLQVEGINRTIFESLRDSIYVAPPGGNAYRLDAYITEGERIFLRRRWVITGQTGVGSLPWRYFRTEAIRSVSRIPA